MFAIKNEIYPFFYPFAVNSIKTNPLKVKKDKVKKMMTRIGFMHLSTIPNFKDRPDGILDTKNAVMNPHLGDESYDLWFPGKKFEDTDFYKNFIKRVSFPALDVGCGTGRLLIPYIESGLNVHGVDLSKKMLEICREKGREKGLKTQLFCQAMQNLSLPYRYGTIFIAFNSFQLLIDRNDAMHALKKFHSHLHPGGKLLISLFNPTASDVQIEPSKGEAWRIRREAIRPRDGSLVRLYELSENKVTEQVQQNIFRIEATLGDKLIEYSERKFSVKWYLREEFIEMLKMSGFGRIKCLKQYEETAAEPQDTSYVFVASNNDAILE